MFVTTIFENKHEYKKSIMRKGEIIIMEDYRKIQEIQRINRIKEKNDCLICEVVITKEFKEAPISVVQGNGGSIEMAQMVKTLTDVAESLKREFPEIKEIIPMLNQNSGRRTAYKQVESWGRF